MSSDEALAFCTNFGVSLPVIVLAIMLGLLWAKRDLDVDFWSFAGSSSHTVLPVLLSIANGRQETGPMTTLFLGTLWGYMYWRGPPKVLLDGFKPILFVLSGLAILLAVLHSMNLFSVVVGLGIFVVSIHVLFVGVDWGSATDLAVCLLLAIYVTTTIKSGNNIGFASVLAASAFLLALRVRIYSES